MGDGDEDESASFYRKTGDLRYLSKFVRGGFPPPSPRRFESTRETLLEAAARLRVAKSTIRMRIERYGWSERDALRFERFERPSLNLGRASPKGARPGVKLSPLTAVERVILRCLADGMRPREIHEAGGLSSSIYGLHQRIDRMRLKLDAFTTAEMVAVAIRRGIIA